MSVSLRHKVIFSKLSHYVRTYHASFSHQANIVSTTDNDTKINSLSSSENTLRLHNEHAFLSGVDPELVEEVVKCQHQLNELNLRELKPALQPSYNLAPYVPRSITLTRLYELGVELGRLETIPGVASLLVKLDFEEDVVPVLQLLHRYDVEAEHFATVINRHPNLFKESIEDMEAIVNLLLGLDIKKKDLAHIIIRNPAVLSATQNSIRSHLQKLEKVFLLSAEEALQICIQEPNIFTFPEKHFEFIGPSIIFGLAFRPSQLKTMILRYPKILMTSRAIIFTNYAFLHGILDLEPEHICKFPKALCDEAGVLKPRAQFLNFLDKLQLDQDRPMFTSLDQVVAGDDEEFCVRYGVPSVQKFKTFLKTL